jgi:hypothetical protein
VIYRDQLEKVYALIERPENWCQKHYALSEDGCPVYAESPLACRWCLDGAVQVVSPCNDYDEWKAALGHHNPIAFNDSHDHDEVLELLRNAIERAPVRA